MKAFRQLWGLSQWVCVQLSIYLYFYCFFVSCMYPLQCTYFTMPRFSCASGSSERLLCRKEQKFRFHPPAKEFVAADSSACFVVELGWIVLLTFDNVYGIAFVLLQHKTSSIKPTGAWLGCCLFALLVFAIVQWAGMRIHMSRNERKPSVNAASVCAEASYNERISFRPSTWSGYMYRKENVVMLGNL